jgi:hypothetical protein
VPAAVTHADSVTPVSGSQGAAQAALYAAATIPTNEPGAMTYPAPQASFAATTASDADLAHYGFPPRPDPSQAPEVYRNWLQVVSAAKHPVSISFTPEPGYKNNEISYNWSGTVVTHPTNPFLAAQGEWVVPSVATSTQVAHSSTWVGIDGSGDQPLAQLGTDQNALPGGLDYHAWIELLPANETRMSLPVAPGQWVYAYMSYNTSVRAVFFYLENVTAGYYQSFTLPYNLPGQSAEWIVERPTVNGQLSALAPFGSVTMTDSYAYSGGAWYGANTTPFATHIFNLYGASRRLDAFARPVNATTDQMVWTGYN